MAGQVVKKINDNFYLVIDEIGGSSGIESETESVDLGSSKISKGNPAIKDNDTCKTEKINISDAATQYFITSTPINNPSGEKKNSAGTVNHFDSSMANTDVKDTDNIQITENTKSSDPESENLESVNMDIDNDSDEGEVGLEEESVPIIKISFRDEEIEKSYKPSFMKFLTQKINRCTVLTNAKNNLELEIFENQSENMLDFHLDTTPGSDSWTGKVPSYGKNHDILLSDSGSLQETTPKSEVSSPVCFNCLGKHYLRDCLKQRDMEKIVHNRNKYQSSAKTPKARYHLEDNQRFGNIVPGELSKKLRNALDLSKDQLPLFMYRMRLLGYPPGWLEEARVSHSGVVVYDSNGQPITEGEEEGEILPHNADRFDISKIIEFPGFNVPLPKNIKEEGNIHGCPPMSEDQSKENLIKKLEPNALQAYRKRSLTLPKSSPQDTTSTDKTGKRSTSPTIEEMEEKKRQLLLELNNEDDNGEYKSNQNQTGEGGDSEEQPDASENSTIVKNMDFGTPVLKSVSLYSKLPSREQFSVNVSKVINFENLPKSTGKYESMSNLINKIRNTVSRIKNEENT